MKKLLTAFLVTVVVLVCSVDTQATIEGITILSQQYHVIGYAQTDTGYNTYDEMGNSPLNRSVSGFNTGSEGVYGQNSAQSITDLFYVYLYANGWDEAPEGCGWGRAIAEATWVFSPLTSDLHMQVTGWDYRQDELNQWSLTDLTTGINVVTMPVSFLPSGEDNIPWEEVAGIEGSYQFDPTHQYAVHVLLDTGYVFSPPDDCGWSATFVPEPATLLLLGFGAVMLKRKRKVLSPT